MLLTFQAYKIEDNEQQVLNALESQNSLYFRNVEVDERMDQVVEPSKLNKLVSPLWWFRVILD